MRKALAMLCGAFALIVGSMMLASPASATDEHLPAAPWVANGQSDVIDATTIKLQDHVSGDTSVENPSVGLNIQAGDEISVEYELEDGATCQTGEPRLFAFVNGALNKSDLCDASGDGAASGVLSFEAASSGLVTQVGLVYSRNVGHVIMRNLTVDGVLVLFTEREVEETESPTPTPTSTAPEPTPTSTVEPSATPSVTPDVDEAALPVTGSSVGGLAVGGLVVLVVGGGLVGGTAYLNHRRKQQLTRGE